MIGKKAFLTCPDCKSKLGNDFKFCAYCGTALKSSGSNLDKKLKNERRDVSVLFADVSGFTSMCETMDPEDVFTLMNDVFTGLGNAINAQGGHIDKYIGDNVMALFGAPVAHENDPYRACKAALNMQSFLRDFARKLHKKTGVLLKMRIGINCGLVLAGSIGSKVKREYSVLGDNVNLASRLESNAPPGGILISDSIARRISGFDLAEPRLIKVKGKSEPVTAYELLGIQQGKAIGVEPGSIYINRKIELNALAKLLKKFHEFKKPIAILGDAGTGKTRLIYELLKSHQHITAVWGRDLKQNELQPFGFVSRLLRENLGELAGDENIVLEPLKLKSYLIGLDPELSAFIPAILHLLFPETFSPPDRDPIFLRRTTEAGLHGIFNALGKKHHPMVLVLDSFETADQSSIKTIKKILNSVNPGNFLTIIASRKNIEGFNWQEKIEIQSLNEDDSETLMRNLLKDVHIPEKSLTGFLNKAAGNPLFIKELASWAIRIGKKNSNEDVLLPPSLRAIIVSRLDQLSHVEQEFVRVCSVQGQQFDLNVSVKAGKFKIKDLELKILPDLEMADIVARSPYSNQNEWFFKQNLLQEVCYETMLLKDRRSLHLSTAKALIEISNEHNAVPPELLAYHYERAEEWKNSAISKLQAGDKAKSFGLYNESLCWFRGALEDLGRLNKNVKGSSQILFPIYEGLTQVLVRTGDTEEAVKICSSLQKQARKPDERIAALRLMAELARIQGDFKAAESFFQKGITLFKKHENYQRNLQLFSDYAEHLLKAGRFSEALEAAKIFRKYTFNDARTSIQADTLEGKIEYAQGNFSSARTLFLRAYKASKQQPGLSEKAISANLLGNNERDLGNYTKARKYFLDALKAWERAGDIEGIAGGNNNLANLAMSVGDFKLSEKHHSEALKRWKNAGNVAGAALSLANLAILSLEQGRGIDAVSHARNAMQSMGAGGNVTLTSFVRVIEGEGLFLSGDAEEAEKRFSQVLKEFSPERARLAHAGAKRGLGKIQALKNNFIEALRFFTEAEENFVQLKRSQEATRTGVLIAETLLKQGEKVLARRKLVEAEKAFATMKAAKDLTRVRSLLKKINRN